ncbi:hypothetical protein A6R68_20062, partial [Neotoma lepida]
IIQLPKMEKQGRQEEDGKGKREKDGQVEVREEGKEEPRHSVETINDGNFHIVELLTLDSSLSLSVDGGSPKIITNLSKQSTLNFDSPLY